jgi:hypothetical protein
MIDTEGFIDDVFISWQRRASRRCAGSTPVILTILPRHVSEQHTKVSVFQCMSTTDRSAALSCQHDSLGIFINTKVLDRYAHHLLALPAPYNYSGPCDPHNANDRGGEMDLTRIGSRMLVSVRPCRRQKPSRSAT